MQTETKSPAVAPEAEMEGPVEARKEYRCVRTSLSKKKEAYSSYIAHVLKPNPNPVGGAGRKATWSPGTASCWNGWPGRPSDSPTPSGEGRSPAGRCEGLWNWSWRSWSKSKKRLSTRDA
ncbi:uncharacterized protein LOC114815178 isoform X1 [Ornithorhynchus anatinus]|uniref:uncharacterized protein LOC114815178 isoform X1 n=1 Tax=Ornithorhynchus anatinus TaxID=9258 RepID=UPI0010A7FB05|nr:uncharacterized protein LOC114815178 isoform X1 [Ornithorhynchus anatinus]